MSEESSEDCCGKPDMKKEAQRTNRFDNNTPLKSNSSFSTPCNHLENSSGVNNDYKTEERNDVPCINIILKPILDTKTDQKDKGVQIVEITAVTENNNTHPVNDANTLLPDQHQSCSKGVEKVVVNSVEVQTDFEENIHNIGTQTTETQSDQKNICLCLTEKSALEATAENSTAADAGMKKPNRGVQFKDHNGLDPDAGSLPRDNDVVDLKKTVVTVECSDSMKTLYKSVNSEDSSKRSVDFKSLTEKSGRRTEEKLSDRIKRNIDKLKLGSCVSTQSSAHAISSSQGTQQESIETENKISSCIDTRKDIESRVELFNTSSDKTNSSSATQNTSTLASVFSNNPPVPKLSINTTETTEWESSSKNEPSRVTIDTTISDSPFSPSPDNTPCCSDQKFSIEGISCKTKNPTFDEDQEILSSENQHPNNERITARGNVEKNSNTTKNDVEKLEDEETRGLWTEESTTLSRFGIDGNSSVRTTSTNPKSEARTLESTDGLRLIDNNSLAKENDIETDKCCRSIAVQTNSVSFGQTPAANKKFGEKPDLTLSWPNTRNFITASELTRPEFIRMLTEIKEHTCSLELQLSAMNEAMKRKQASRSKAVSSTLRNYEPVRGDPIAHKMQSKKLKTSDFSSTKHARCAQEESNAENSMGTSSSAFLDDNSLSEDKIPGIETENDGTCSPKNCCSVLEDSSQTMFEAGNLSSINKLEKSDVVYSGVSNSSVNRMIVRPSFMSSTLKKTTGKNSSTRHVSIPPVSGITERNGKHHVPTSPVILGRPKIRPRLGIKQSSSKFRTVGQPKSIPSNSYLRSSPSKESFYKTRHNAKKISPFKLKKFEGVLRPKITYVNSRNSLQSYGGKDDSQACLDSACCSIANDNDEINSEVSFSSQSNRPRAVPAKKILTKLFEQNRGKDHLACEITYDSEEEMSSTEYGFDKSGAECCGKETKDDVNDKKRKRNSGDRKLTKIDENNQNNSRSSQCQKHSEYNLKSKNNSQSIGSNQHSFRDKKFDHFSGKKDHTDSQHKDSKCTIRVTVNLDDTPSNEEVKKI